MRTAYIETRFNQVGMTLISTCDRIVRDYMRQGFRLTLRQLYYQLVSRNIIKNTERSYKNLGNLVSRARLAGLLDWDGIEDRVRVPRRPSQWESPKEIMDAVVSQYRLDRWKGQDTYVELWVEKDALAGVLAPIAEQHHVTLMVNRGYSSQSAMYDAAERFRSHVGRDAVLLYLGDLDPSGEDMVRDIRDRLNNVFEVEVEVTKLAITPEQVAQYNPPPNPAKMSDSRAAGFVARHGYESYEVDALPPNVLTNIINEAIEGFIDAVALDGVMEQEELDKDLLSEAADTIMLRREKQ